MLGLLFAANGILAIVARRIGSGTVREISAAGAAAQFVGAILLIMAVITLVDWVKKLKGNGTK